MALTNIPLPGLAQKSLFLIGEATSGVALFATGLILSGQKLSLNLPTILNVLAEETNERICQGQSFAQHAGKGDAGLKQQPSPRNHGYQAHQNTIAFTHWHG